MRLILVYNAKSGFINSSIDFIHKIVSPNSYDCSLCKLTHGKTKEKEVWRNFLNQTDLKISVLHIDEFEERFLTSYNYPVIVREDDDQLKVIMNKEELKQLKTTESLIEFLEQSVQLQR